MRLPIPQRVHASHRLNLLAALFFPVTAVGSILGIQIANGLEKVYPPYTFWAIVAASILLGLIVRSSIVSATRPRA